jgi:hypothetical protein
MPPVGRPALPCARVGAKPKPKPKIKTFPMKGKTDYLRWSGVPPVGRPGAIEIESEGRIPEPVASLPAPGSFFNEKMLRRAEGSVARFDYSSGFGQIFAFLFCRSVRRRLAVIDNIMPRDRVERRREPFQGCHPPNMPIRTDKRYDPIGSAPAREARVLP